MKLAICISLALAARCTAATIPDIEATPLTLASVRTHQITAARHIVVSVSSSAVAAWMSSGTSALQTKDIPNDVPCPVKLTLDGSLADFSNPEYETINSLSEFLSLKQDIAQTVKIVGAISFCQESGSYRGCTLPPLGPPLGWVPFLRGIHNHVVIAGNFFGGVNELTLTHEFGHNLGAIDVKNDSRRLMSTYAGSRRVVSTEECRLFVR